LTLSLERLIKRLVLEDFNDLGVAHATPLSFTI
jgi:hypothetical protein